MRSKHRQTKAELSIASQKNLHYSLKNVPQVSNQSLKNRRVEAKTELLSLRRIDLRCDSVRSLIW